MENLSLKIGKVEDILTGLNSIIVSICIIYLLLCELFKVQDQVFYFSFLTQSLFLLCFLSVQFLKE